MSDRSRRARTWIRRVLPEPKLADNRPAPRPAIFISLVWQAWKALFTGSVVLLILGWIPGLVAKSFLPYVYGLAALWAVFTLIQSFYRVWANERQTTTKELEEERSRTAALKQAIADVPSRPSPDIHVALLRVEYGTVDLKEHAIFALVRVTNLGHVTSLVDWTCSAANVMSGHNGFPPNGAGQPADMQFDWRFVAPGTMRIVPGIERLFPKIADGLQQGLSYEGWIAFVGFNYAELQHLGEVCVRCVDSFGNDYEVCRPELSREELELIDRRGW